VRVLFTIHHALDPNAGAAGVTVQLARALTAQGHEATIFSWDDLPVALSPRAREALFPGFVARRIRRAVRDGVDVVDSSTTDAWLWLAARQRLGAGRRGPVVVARTHGLEHTYRDVRDASGVPIGLPERLYHGFWRLREAEVTMRLADATLFLNQTDRRRAVDELGVPADRALLVANGIPDAFVGLPAPSARPAGEPVRLVYVGPPDPRKGFDVLLDALAPLLKARSDLRLTLLGTGQPATVPDAVDVVERYAREDLRTLLATQDVLVQPSRAEGFSLALVEAMACGLAPVASAVGAAPDLLGAGAGVLVPPGDATALREAVVGLLEDRERLLTLRTAAHARVQGLGWSSVAADLAATYRRVGGG
jgi:glycosyltransferase involved in cell wall biosynthesis